MTIPKRSKIRHKTPKFFGFADEKEARGLGSKGYARSYGQNKHGNNVDHRTVSERRNRVDRRLDEQEDYDYEDDRRDAA